MKFSLFHTAALSALLLSPDLGTATASSVEPDPAPDPSANPVTNPAAGTPSVLPPAGLDPSAPSAPGPDLAAEVTTLQAENADLTTKLQASEANAADLESQLAAAKAAPAPLAAAPGAVAAPAPVPAPEDTIILDDGSKQPIRLLNPGDVFFLENNVGNVILVAKDRVSNAFRRVASQPNTIIFYAHGVDAAPKDSAEYVSIADINALAEDLTPAAPASEEAKKEDETTVKGTADAANALKS